MRSSANSQSRSLTDQGFAILSGVLDEAECEELINQLGPVTGAGQRGILGLSPIAKLASSDPLLSLVEPHLPAQRRPVRAIYFDKNPNSNWMVTWHQDLTIAVRNKIDVPGFGPWSTKDGVPHVQPPVHLLEQMLTVRLHLDNCDETNGAVRVIPGSHRLGRLSAEDIQKLRIQEPSELCCVVAGGALLMRPLLLHSSGKSRTAGHRRVLHIEYASFALPGGLQWDETLRAGAQVLQFQLAMLVIRLWTSIAAPPERVFDLARSIDAHQNSAEATQERAVAGVTRGLIGLGEEVTWEARHFGIKQRLTVRITSFERPARFQDVMVSGAFKSMKHDHEFVPQPLGTLMVDRFEFESPFGIVGRIVDRIFLAGYLRRFLVRRNEILKNLAESEDWKKFII
jgi:ligand-binding SRPBCC domain-containing protein